MPNYLFHNGALLLSGNTILENAWLHVENGKIAKFGALPFPAYLPLIEKTEKIDLQNNLLMPGFINAHTHSAMTLFRGLGGDLPLMDWLNKYIFPAEKNLTADWVKWGTLLAAIEMIKSGTTTCGDMYLFIETAAKVFADCGMRAVIGEAMYDFPSPNYGEIANGLKYTREFILRWQNHPLIKPIVNVHAPYTCSPDLLQTAHAMAVELNTPLHLHLAETEVENAEIEKRYGARPLQHLNNLGLLDERLLAAHAIWLNDDELDIVAEKRIKILHNPQSNLKLIAGVAKIPKMLQRGITVGLGTDGAASNNGLDMFREMKTAALIHKWNTHDATAIAAPVAVKLATNAAALTLENITGVIAIGKAADLIVVDFSSAHLRPCYDRMAQLVYSANGADVKDTMVNGKFLMRERKLLTIDEKVVYWQIDKIAAQLREIVKN